MTLSFEYCIFVGCVQLLLTYLPNDCELWAGELQKRRFQYKAFKDEFLVNPVSLAEDPRAHVTFWYFNCLVQRTM